VGLTVLLALGALGGIGYVVGNQLTALADRLPGYQENVLRKLSVIEPDPQKKTALQKASDLAARVNERLTTAPVEADKVAKVEVIKAPSFRERLQEAVGPYLEFLGVGSFVLILVLFMMANREDLRDRIVALFGHSRVSLTTRTMDEIGQRISRYLATFAAVNSGFGLVVGLGLWAIGVPYAVLWGCLAAMLRFVPYVGPAVAFALPAVFAVAHFPGWREPLEVVALFAVVETILNSFLEPVIYGKTTGVSALGLLVAAMFWTWLWGLLGILLSTPLTVCLAVLGKYVPSLGVFATLLGEEAELDPDVRFYQRLVALDRDGAVAVVDEALKSRPRAEVFDAILIPALSRAERDAAAGNLEEADLAFVGRVVEEIVDELEGAPEITLESVAASAGGNGHPAGAADPSAPPPVLLGVAADGAADCVALKMLGQFLGASGLALEVVTGASTPLALSERVAERSPDLVVLSHLPPS
jgi:predicted PurR-regulated permease PerM